MTTINAHSLPSLSLTTFRSNLTLIGLEPFAPSTEQGHLHIPSV